MKRQNFYRTLLPQIALAKAEANAPFGIEWLNSLDQTIASLQSQWQLRIGDVLSGGSENFLIDVLMENGTAAVLKIGLPGTKIMNEARALQIADGRGYAKLYRVDHTRGALLLERLGVPLSATPASIDEHIHVICTTLKSAWATPDIALGLPTARDKAQQMGDHFDAKWALLGKPCTWQTLRRAYEFIEERIDAFTPENCVLVHGDAHGFNTLASVESGYKFVDPDGLFAEKACDLVCLMRDWSEQLLSGDTVALMRKRCRNLAELCDVDEVSIWQWGYLGRIAIGLVLLEFGMADQAKKTLEVADRLNHVQPS